MIKIRLKDIIESVGSFDIMPLTNFRRYYQQQTVESNLAKIWNTTGEHLQSAINQFKQENADRLKVETVSATDIKIPKIVEYAQVATVTRIDDTIIK